MSHELELINGDASFAFNSNQGTPLAPPRRRYGRRPGRIHHVACR